MSLDLDPAEVQAASAFVIVVLTGALVWVTWKYVDVTRRMAAAMTEANQIQLGLAEREARRGSARLTVEMGGPDQPLHETVRIRNVSGVPAIDVALFYTASDQPMRVRELPPGRALQTPANAGVTARFVEVVYQDPSGTRWVQGPYGPSFLWTREHQIGEAHGE